MPDLAAADTPRKVVVLNPKGGSGKTTLAFSLAGYLASAGRTVGLLDMDKQRSSSRWLANRPADLPHIHALAPPGDGETLVAVPEYIDVVIIDAPAGLGGDELIDYTCGAHAIFVPVLPSDIDIHAASRLVSDLLLRAEVSRRNGRLGIVANRVKERTIAYRQLLAFLDSLSIDLIGVLRDSQNYTHAAAGGLSIHEMTVSRVGKDMAQWQVITDWLETRLAAPITPRDLRRPRRDGPTPQPARSRRWLPAAAIGGALAVTVWFLSIQGTPRTDPAAPPAAQSGLLRAGPVHPIITTPNALPGTTADSGETLADRWRLTGVVQSRGRNVLILADREDGHTVRLDNEDELDGWTVTESGRDFAVFTHEGRRIRLQLNDETML